MGLLRRKEPAFEKPGCEVARNGFGCGACAASGLLPGTPVLTNYGWIDVAQVRVGDLLETFEDGPLPVAAVSTSEVWSSNVTCPNGFWPFLVPAGILGNAAPLLVLPDHDVIFECDILEEITGDPFALVPIRALDGFQGIKMVPPPGRRPAIDIRFEGPTVICVGSGAYVSCAPMNGLDSLLGAASGTDCRQVLSLPKARAMVEYLIGEGLCRRPVPEME